MTDAALVKPLAPSTDGSHQALTLTGFGAVALLISVNLSALPLVSLAPIVLVAYLTVLRLLSQNRIAVVGLISLPFLGFMLVSGAFAGSLPTSGAALAAWLTADGRALTAFLPLVFLGSSRVRRADYDVFVRGVVVMVWANLLLYGATLGGVLPKSLITIRKLSFNGLTSSHHAVGLLMGVAMLVLLAELHRGRISQRRLLLTLLAAFIVLIVSGSRTAMVGLLSVGLYQLVRHRKASEILRVFAVLVVGVGVVLVFSAKELDTVSSLFSPDFQRQAAEAFWRGMDQPEAQTYNAGLGEGYLANIIIRFFYFGIAIGFFVASPLVGIGAFRYTDSNLTFSGTDGLVYVATSGTPEGAELIGAHNQFLGVLAEGGLLGIALFMLIWVHLFRAGRRVGDARHGQLVRNIVVFSLATGLTGYTMTSPALTFIALTAVGLLLRVQDSAVDDTAAVRAA